MKRNLDNALILGVCSGLADNFNLNVVLIRTTFVISTLFFGFGPTLYLILWLVMILSEKK